MNTPTPTPPVDCAASTEPVPSRFIQCCVPTELYEWLRLQGFLTRRGMSSVARTAIAAYRAEVEAGRIAPERGMPVRGDVVKYTVRVDDELHAWLRTTAFYARTSITVLAGAALAHAQRGV